MVKPCMGVFRKIKKPKPRTPGVPNINWKQLTKRCRQKIKSFASDGFKTIDTPDGPYFFKDNGAEILAVAHLDTRLGAIHTAPLRLSYDTLFFCPSLDDRLGVYAILDYLPKRNIVYDILLTVGEENGQSTARYFEPPKGKKYRWMFSFDRAGTDVVMYQYESLAAEIYLEQSGWKLGAGTYSDISDLEHLRCEGFNFGIGYYSEHTLLCHMSRADFMKNIRKFTDFYNKWKEDTFPYTPAYNIYTHDYGFECVNYVEHSLDQAIFTEKDIQVIETMEQSGYNFPVKVTKRNIKEVILDFTKVKSDKEYLKNIQEAINQPTLFDKRKIKEEDNESKGQIERHRATGKIESKDLKDKIKRITKLPLIQETNTDKEIYGSEDSPEYSGIKGTFKRPRKVERSDEVLDNNKNVAVTVITSHKGKEFLTAFSNELKKSKKNLTPIGLDECSQCHRPTEFYPGDTNTLCEECYLGNLQDNTQNTDGMEYETNQGYQKARIVSKLAINQPGEKDARYNYERREEEGKGWRWVGSFPEKELTHAT